MKIAVLRDYSYAERPGEDELAQERLLWAAPEGVELRVYPPNMIAPDDLADAADLVLTFGLKRYADGVLDRLIASERPAHVHVAQDWWDGLQPQEAYRDRVVASARATIFSSPLHERRYRRLYDARPRFSWVIPPPIIGTDYARSSDVPLPDAGDAVVSITPWHPDYGSDLLLRWAEREQVQLHVYGLGVPQGEITPNVQGCGPVALDALLPTLAQYKRAVFLPRVPAPFGFPSLAAYLAGLDVSYTGEIGWMTYGDAGSMHEEAFADAPRKFWQAVLSCAP